MKAMMPMMMPTKHASSDRIMRARVASKWAVLEGGGGVKGQRSRVGFRLKCRSRQVSDMRRVSIQAIKLSPKTGRASTLNTIPYISKNDKSIVSTLVFFLWRNATDKRLLTVILITTVNTSTDVTHGRGAQRSLPIVSLCVKHFPGIQ